LGHVSTFLDKYKLRQKGSITTMRTPIDDLRGQLRRGAVGATPADEWTDRRRVALLESNAILSGVGSKKPAPCSCSGEQKESRLVVFGTILLGSRA